MPKIPKHSFSDTQGNDVPLTPLPTTSRNSRCHSKYYQIVKEQPPSPRGGKKAATASRSLPEATAGARLARSYAMGSRPSSHRDENAGGRFGANRVVHSATRHRPSRGSRPGRGGPSGRREWRRPGSNRQPPACKAGALPVELRPRLGPREPPQPGVGQAAHPGKIEAGPGGDVTAGITAPHPTQWAHVDSNHGPQLYQSCALTN